MPIVFSLCAISLTIFQAMSTRRHARLSVQPRVDWRIFEKADEGTLELSLVNVGLGPAIIRNLALVVDGEAIPTTGVDACHEVNRRIGRSGEAWDFQCFDSDEEYVLRPGDTVLIYASRRAPGHAAGDLSSDDVDYKRFGASATYCSFYEDCWPLKPE